MNDWTLAWYLLQCDPRNHPKVEGLTAIAGYETFAPRVPKTRKRNGDKPLFPGYLFVRLSLGRGDQEKLRYLPGTRGLVEIGGGPCPVDEEIVEGLRWRLTSGAFAPPQINKGDRVRVVTGLFAELEGIFCENLSGTDRVAVLIEMMARHVRIQLPCDAVEVLERREVAG